MTRAPAALVLKAQLHRMDTNGLFEPNRPREALKYFESKVAFTTGPVEVERALRDGERIILIDVRAAEDFEKGHVPGAVNLPEDEWTSLRGLSKDKLNVLYCYSVVCHLAARAAVRFAAAGFPVMEMDGGFESWKDHDLPVEHGDQKIDLRDERKGFEASNPDLARNYDANTDTNVNAFAPR